MSLPTDTVLGIMGLACIIPAMARKQGMGAGWVKRQPAANDRPLRSFVQGADRENLCLVPSVALLWASKIVWMSGWGCRLNLIPWVIHYSFLRIFLMSKQTIFRTQQACWDGANSKVRVDLPSQSCLHFGLRERGTWWFSITDICKEPGQVTQMSKTQFTYLIKML